MILLLLGSAPLWATAAPAKVLYLSPFKADYPLAQLYDGVMRAAARKLNFDLRIEHLHEDERYSRQRLRQLLQQPTDYLLTPYTAHTHHLLAMAEKKGIKTLLMTNPLPENALIKLSLPRQKYRNWLGSVQCNNFNAGKQLADLLIQRARLSNKNKSSHQPPAANNSNSKTALSILAFNGHRNTQPATERRRGLLQSATVQKVKLSAHYYNHWNPVIAIKPLASAIKRYPDASIFWAASDGISLSIIQQLKAIGLHPNQDFFSAGIDWSDEGIVSIEQGEMLASLGGQFLVAGWAMILLYDYHHGLDFKPYGLNYSTKLHEINRDNVAEMKALLNSANWDRIDFKSYSQKHSESFEKYRFDVMNLLQSRTSSQ